MRYRRTALDVAQTICNYDSVAEALTMLLLGVLFSTALALNTDTDRIGMHLRVHFPAEMYLLISSYA